MPTKDCVEHYYRRRFALYTLAVGLIVVGIMAAVIYG
jgi:hypothetical protein